jgi:hypothetical protein
VHLTFQEYFAALYLKEQTCSPRFARGQVATDERISAGVLFGWSGEPLWHEAILFLHELVSNEPEWAKDLEEWTFGPHAALTADEEQSAWFGLICAWRWRTTCILGWIRSAGHVLRQKSCFGSMVCRAYVRYLRFTQILSSSHGVKSPLMFSYHASTS